jgi:hypothetical protein
MGLTPMYFKALECIFMKNNMKLAETLGLLLISVQEGGRLEGIKKHLDPLFRSKN